MPKRSGFIASPPRKGTILRKQPSIVSSRVL
jgi:hypothetical protein